MQVGLFSVRQVSGYGDYPAKGCFLPGPWVRQGTSCLTSPPEPGYHWLIETLHEVDYLTGIMYRHTEEKLSADGTAGGTSGLVQG